MTLDERVAELKAGLDAVGPTDGAIEAALRRAVRDALARAAAHCRRYHDFHRGCAVRRAAARHLAEQILADADE